MTPKNPRILVISSSFPLHQSDIRGIFIGELVKNLSTKKFEIIVLTPHLLGSPFYEDQDGIIIYRFPYFFPFKLQKLCGQGGMYFGFSNSFLGKIQVIPYIFIMFFYAFFIIQKKRVSIIHSHWIIPQGFVGAVIRRMINIPHILSVHGTDIHLINSKKLLKSLFRFVGMNTDLITTNSTHTDLLVQKCLSSAASNTFVIPMGINIPDFLNNRKSSSDNCRKEILYVGRLIFWKGVQILIEAFSQILKTQYDCILIIVGDGPIKGDLEELAYNLHISSSVSFLGNISQKDLNYRYSKANVFVLPSINYMEQTEGLGVVLLEAMASGVPVIGSNIGGIPDIIEDGVNGLLVSPGDPQGLADAIIQILENPELAARFREAGLKTVRDRFSWDKISDQFIEVYQEVLHESNEV